MLDEYKKFRIIVCCIVAFFFIVIGLTLFFAYPITYYDGTVTGRRWENTIEVASYQLCTESDWSLPEEATLIETRSEYHYTYYTHIPAGKSFITIPHEVYDNKYYYTINRWVHIHDLDIVTKGTDKHPYYGECNLPTNIDNPALGDLIQYNKKSECYIQFVVDDTKYEKLVDYNDWMEIEVNDPFEYKSTYYKKHFA